MSEDRRNLVDEFKGLEVDDIVNRLDAHAHPLEIAVENTLRDFNMGSIIRTANAFGVRTVHVVGRRQWNKRGAMKTDAYMHMMYHEDFESLRDYSDKNDKIIVAIDNVAGAVTLAKTAKNPRSILLFGQEGPGLSSDALASSESVVAIEQYGSTRSLNVAAAAAIAIYAWRHGHIG